MGKGFSSPASNPSSSLSVFSPASVSNASGNLVIQEVAVRPLTQDMLLHEVCHQFHA